MSQQKEGITSAGPQNSTATKRLGLLYAHRFGCPHVDWAGSQNDNRERATIKRCGTARPIIGQAPYLDVLGSDNIKKQT